MISIGTSAGVGKNYVQIIGTLPNKQAYFTYMSLEGLAVPAPTFSTSPLPDLSLTAVLGTVLQSLPAISTLTGTTATFSINTLEQDGVTVTPSFIVNSPDLANNRLELKNALFADVGTHSVNLVLTNGFASTTYPFLVTVTNDQPEFLMT
jgi:hypothetical protein